MSNEKKPFPKVDLRKPYYEASDGIYSLFDKIRTLDSNDQDLKDQAAKLVIELNKLNELMDNKYNWD